ncbi:MAG: hypothetical protein Aureis2KO_14660 [Aureisphaera sp.]
MKHLLYLSTFLLFFAGNSLYAQKSLQYDFEVGDEFKIEQTARQEMTQEIQGMTNITINNISGAFHFKVIEASEDKFVLETTYLSLVLKSESDMIGVLMDINTERDKDKEDLEAQIFQGLLNVPFEIHMQKTGKIISLKNTEALIDGMISKSSMEDGIAKDTMKKSLDSEFGGDSLAESMEQLLYLYPNEPVKVGDTWTNNYTGALSADNTWKLDSFASDAFTISANSTITMNESEEGSFELTLAGAQETSATVETKTGFPKEIAVSHVAEGVTSVQGTEIPTKLTTTITYKRL